MNQFKIVLILAFLICGINTLQATPITTQGDLNPLDTVLNFESLSLGFTSNPFTISGATFSSSSSMQVSSNSGTASGNFPTFIQGNYLTSPQIALASNPIKIVFSQLISEFGVGIYDPNFSGNILSVFNSSGQLLESVESATGPVGGSFADFIGVIRSTNDIASVEIVAAPLDFIGIDNITIGSAPVPLPPTVLLFGSGVVGLLGFRRRNKA